MSTPQLLPKTNKTNQNPLFYSLLKPDKYAARRVHKESSAISTITSDRDMMNNGGRNGGQSSMQQSYYDRDNRHTQVKTYTDQGNGYSQRSGSSTLYSKVGNEQIL